MTKDLLLSVCMVVSLGDFEDICMAATTSTAMAVLLSQQNFNSNFFNFYFS